MISRLARTCIGAVALLLGAVSTLSAQTGATISGRVTNDQGVGLPGATVLIQGTTIGTHTDDEGRYTIVVPSSRANGQSSILLARTIGYAARTVPVTLTSGANLTQDFSLVVNPLNLDVVVVTGAGTSTTRERLTTTINSVDSSALKRSANPQNVVSALAAQAPNVEVRTQSGEPGASASIKIRGAASLSGTNQPLFVVDGQPIDNQTFSTQSIATGSGTAAGADASTVAPNRASDINPADIESIQILKSAAAAAIYGARAANGVVLITTKSGIPGTTKYTLSSTETFDRVNSPDILQHTFVQGLNGVAASCGGPDCTVSRWSWGPAATAGTQLFDHSKELFDTGITADNNLQISGGNDRTTFYASGGLMNQNGYLKGPNNKYNRASVRLKGTQQLNSKLKVSGNLSYVDTRGKFVQKGSNLSGLMLGALRTPPNFNNADTYLPNGLQRAYRFPNATSVAAMESHVFYDNPFFVMDNPGNRSELGRSVSNLNLDWNPLDWLNVSETLGADYYNDWRLETLPLTSGGDAVGNVTRNDINNLEIDHNLIATAKHTFGTNTDLTFTVGQNLNSRRLRQTYAFGEQLIAPTPYNIQNTITPRVQEYRALRHIEAYFAQAEVSLLDQLVVNLGIRNDGFSTFGSANPRANYPKASAAWTFSNFLNRGRDRSGMLSYGKLHFAYGETGKEPPAYAAVTALSSTTFFGLGGYGDLLKPGINGQGALSTGLTQGNPDLRPERNREAEFGADLAFLNSKIDMSATAYNKRGSDIILSAPINASATGSTNKILNAAEISNKGVELTLNLHPIQQANAGWDIGVQFGRNRGKVLSLNGADFINYNLEGFTGAIGTSAVGFAPGVIQGNDFVRCGRGVTNIAISGLGVVQDVDASVCSGAPKGALVLGDDGLPVADPTLRIIADPNPKYTMSYSSQIRWNKLSLSGLLDVRKGGSIWNGTRGVLDFFGTGADTKARTRAGQYGVNYQTNIYPVTVGPGKTVVPFQTAADWQNWFLGDGGGFGSVGAQFVEDGSFAKLREISLTYTFDNPTFRNLTGFSSADIRIAGRNLHTWTKYTGFDPEVNLGGAEFLTQGLDYFINPPTRSFVLSFSLNR